MSSPQVSPRTNPNQSRTPQTFFNRSAITLLGRSISYRQLCFGGALIAGISVLAFAIFRNKNTAVVQTIGVAGGSASQKANIETSQEGIGAAQTIGFAGKDATQELTIKK